jgi:protein-tyrosine phosphatase
LYEEVSLIVSEIVPRVLYQADGAIDIEGFARDRDLAPALAIDLVGLPAERIPSSGRVAYVRWPIDDGPLHDLRVLSAIERMGALFIEGGGAVVCVCNMGLNRSGLMSALIVARHRRVSGGEALRFVRSKCPGALRNPAFAEYLERR